MAQSAKKLGKLPKEKLIEMAVAKINEPKFRANSFTRVQIWLDADELTVEFAHVIQFIPKHGQFYYSVSVGLISGSTSRSIQGHGSDNEEILFYDSEKFKTQLEFIFNAINNNPGEVGKINPGELPDGTMTIKEEDEHYEISVDSYSTYSFYKIQKGTGKVYDGGHKHYDRSGSTASKRKKIY